MLALEGAAKGDETHPRRWVERGGELAERMGRRAAAAGGEWRNHNKPYLHRLDLWQDASQKCSNKYRMYISRMFLKTSIGPVS